MLQRELTREQAIAVAEQVLQHVEGTIIERGYSYFSDGVVFNTRVENNRTLCSDVQGSQVYHVRLDLEEVQGSSCTCPYTRLCKHIAATFFKCIASLKTRAIFWAKPSSHAGRHFHLPCSSRTIGQRSARRKETRPLLCNQGLPQPVPFTTGGPFSRAGRAICYRRWNRSALPPRFFPATKTCCP